MKIIAISDTHLTHEKRELSIPDGDILIHAGDATLNGSKKEIIVFNRWFSDLPHAIKIFVAGNHDWLFEKNLERARELLDHSIHYLQDSEITIAGLRIYGSPWQPAFNNWAFNLERGNDLKQKWDFIPSGIDILITHCSPYGIGDMLPDGSQIGCADLAKVVRKIKPKYHIFGHAHEGYGIYKRRNNNTVYINASILDEAYNPANQAIVIEI